MRSGREILRDAGVGRWSRSSTAPSHPRRELVAGRHRGRARAARHGLLAAQARARRRRPRTVAADPDAGPIARAFVAYEARDRGARRARLRRPGPARARRARATTRRCSRAGATAARTCSSTRSRTSTAPSSGWRCCWRRRPTGSSSSATTTSRSTAGGWPMSVGSWRWTRSLPGLRRVDLEVNHRCPRAGRGAGGPPGRAQPRAVRQGRSGRDPMRPGRSILAPDPTDEPARTERALRSWPDDDGDARRPGPDEPRAAAGGRSRRWPRRCRSARRGRPPRRRPGARRPARARGRRDRPDGEPLLGPPRARSARTVAADGDRGGTRSAAALLAWAPRLSTTSPSLVAAIDDDARRLAELRRDDAALTLATAHCDQGSRVRPRRRRRHGGGPLPERPDGRRGGRPGPRLRGGAAPRLRRLDPGAPDADAAVRPGGPLPVPARGVQPGGARAQRGRAREPSSSPVELAQQPVDRVEERLGQVRAAARRGPSPWRRRPPGSAIAVGPERRAGRRRAAGPAAARGTRPSASDPAPGRGQQPVGVPRGREARPRRSPAARAARPRDGPRPGSRSVIRRLGPHRAVAVRAGIRRREEQQRQPLALRAVDEDPERVVARRREGQVPEVDREGQDGVAAVALAAGHEAAGRAGDLAAVGIEQDEPDLVLAVGLGRRDLAAR